MDRDDNDSQTVSIKVIKEGPNSIKIHERNRNMNLNNASSSQHFYSGNIRIGNSKSGLYSESSKSDDSFEDFSSDEDISRDNDLEMKSAQEHHHDLLQPQRRPEPQKHLWKSQIGKQELK